MSKYFFNRVDQNKDRIYSIIFISIFLFTCFACDEPNQAAKNKDSTALNNRLSIDKDLSNIKVGYSSPSQNAPFYVVLSKYVKKYAKEYGMQFIMTDGQNDILKQITSIEDMITTGLDVLILNPLDYKALVPAVNAASEAGIDVFIVDSQIDVSADYITSVQASNEGNGELLGEWVIKKLKGRNIQAAIISGSQGNPVGKEKRLGFVRGFVESQLMTEGKSNLTIVSQGWGNWSLLGGMEAMDDILVAHPEINLLVAENDAMGMGALKVIQETDRSGKITVVGFDGQKEAYELILKGQFGATALNSPEELARLVVESVVKYLNGESINKIIYTPAVLITKENVNEYYNPDALF